MVKTITLTGTETAVTGLDGAHAHIRNDGADIIYASKSAGIIAGADGVIAIPAGNAAALYGISGAVYISGAGAATVVTSDYVESPFKTSAQAGGSGADEVARAAISSHAGNAEVHVSAEDRELWNAVNYINPNLLINPDFAVNQRGEAEYSGNGEYGVDCWKIYGDAKISVVSGGVIFSRQAGAASGAVFQPNERLLGLIGETVTLSVVVDGQRYTKSMVVPASGQSEILTAPNGNWFLYKQAGFVQISCSCTENTNVISRVKVERGGIATEFVSPDIATELAKCQRYYQIRSTGDIAAVDLRPSMRTITDIKQRSDGNYEYIAEL